MKDNRPELYHKREQFIADKIKEYPDLNISLDRTITSKKTPILNTLWTIYKTDSLNKNWNWTDYPDNYYFQSSVGSKISKLLSATSCFETRDNIVNPICITVGDSYWVHPGTHRYYLNKVCDDFDLPAIIVDVNGYNEYKIKSDFDNVEPFTDELILGARSRLNSYHVLPVSTAIDNSFYELEWDVTQRIFNKPYALKIYMGDKHFLTVPNGRQEKCFMVKDMLGLTQLAIHQYSDPDYEFKELYYEPL